MTITDDNSGAGLRCLAGFTPEGPHIALEEARGLMDYMTPAVLQELAEVALRRISDEAAQVAILNRLCRADSEVWGNVAEQLTQLISRQHTNALSAQDEARKLRADADVIERYSQARRMSAETCVLQILRALPVNLTSGLLGADFQTVGEAE